MEESINYKQLFEKVVTEKEQLLIIIDELKEKYNNTIDDYENKIKLLSEHLKKYTSHQGAKKYYEKNKEKIIEKSKEYIKNNKPTIDSNKIKEYNKRAYEKRKQKKLENNNI
jgi:hypothetical protein